MNHPQFLVNDDANSNEKKNNLPPFFNSLTCIQAQKHELLMQFFSLAHSFIVDPLPVKKCFSSIFKVQKMSIKSIKHGGILQFIEL
jgi:hypothetical protein